MWHWLPGHLLFCLFSFFTSLPSLLFSRLIFSLSLPCPWNAICFPPTFCLSDHVPSAETTSHCHLSSTCPSVTSHLYQTHLLSLSCSCPMPCASSSFLFLPLSDLRARCLFSDAVITISFISPSSCYTNFLFRSLSRAISFYPSHLLCSPLSLSFWHLSFSLCVCLWVGGGARQLVYTRSYNTWCKEVWRDWTAKKY